MTGLSFRRATFVIWLLASLLLILVSAQAIVSWQFPDPDDQMRLLEVRDWLAGQSWFDVGQYRLNRPDGVPMHWSRLVDLPIAAVILVARPVLGGHAAETLASVVVPLLTLGVVIALLASLSRRLLASDEQALMAVCVALLSTEVLHQLRPMRIDHHGWQMALALAAAVALVGRPSRAAGCVVGVALAAWLSISLEGLPMAGAILALVAFRWALAPSHRAMLVATTGMTAVTAIVIFALSHSLSAWRGSPCDAVSPAYLAVLGVAAFGTALLSALPLRSPVVRVTGLAIVAVLALIPIAAWAPLCTSGPFGHLDPLVRRLWYLRVQEGLPLWHQPALTMVSTVALPLIGVAGAAVAWRTSDGARRDAWLVMLCLLTAATLAAIMTQRAGAVANLLAAAPAVSLLFPFLQRARGIDSPLKRTLATLGIFLAAAPGLAVLPVAAVAAPNPGQTKTAKRIKHCTDNSGVRALGALPAGNMLAPLDISPTILLLTPSSAVASGHHRGEAAMRDVIAAFTGSDARARAIVTERRIDYVAFCPGVPEIFIYERYAPDGFLAHLDRGRAPAWLTPILLPGSAIKVWRVR